MQLRFAEAGCTKDNCPSPKRTMTTGQRALWPVTDDDKGGKTWTSTSADQTCGPTPRPPQWSCAAPETWGLPLMLHGLLISVARLDLQIFAVGHSTGVAMQIA